MKLFKKSIKAFLIVLFAGQSMAFASISDTTKNELYGWNLNRGYLIVPMDFDTTIQEFHILNYIDRFSISNSYFGTIGSPWKSNLYSERVTVPTSDFFFDQNYYLNLLTAENQPFFHAKKPYFDIEWTSAPKKRSENQLNALFTQNINKKWNVGARYRLIASGGEYPRAIISQHSWNIFTSYTGEKYSMHAAYVRNNISPNENGGVKDTLDPEFAQALIASARSTFYKRSFFISQQYKFGFTQKIVVDDTTTISNFKEAGRLNYIIRFDRNYRVYRDEEPKSGYYDDIYIDSLETRDSVHLSKLENSLFWTFKEINRENFKGRLTIGSTSELLKWSHLNETDTVYDTDLYHSIKLYANLDARTKNFIFSVDGSYYLKGENGYKEFDYDGNLLISKSLNIFKYKTNFYIKLAYKSISPNLFELSYRSNHFRWQNSFSDLISSNARFGIDIDKVKMNAELFYGSIQNYIYFDTLAIPRQLSGSTLNILTFSLKKEFKLGGFRSVNKMVYQLPSDNRELNLPVLAIYHSLFFDKTFEKIDVQAQLGYDLNYTSKFQAQGYMPASGVFYLSNYRTTGNYAILNLFFKLRIKNVLLFAKMEHFNNQFLFDKYYFLLDKYPAGTSIFKFGVSWRFKD